MDKSNIIPIHDLMRKYKSNNSVVSLNKPFYHSLSSKSVIHNLPAKKRNSNLSRFRYNSHIPNKFRFRQSLEIEDINNEKLKSLNVMNKRKRSLLYTELQLKNKIKKDLSTQINTNDITYHINNHDENLSNALKHSKIKENTKKKIVNKKLKKKNSFEATRKIFRKKYLYDSLEDSEEINDLTTENFYISPEKSIIVLLDFLIILCLGICTLYIPLKITYYKANCVNINLFDKFCFLLIDSIFIIDLLISFSRGYYNKELNLITNNKKIVKKYLSTYFIYDFISAFPFLSLLLFYYINICNPYNINNNKHLLIVFSFCLKIFKYKKVRESNKFMDNINEFFSKNYLSEQIFSTIKMIIKYFAILHLLVCLNIFVGYHYSSSWLVFIKEKYGIYKFSSFYVCSFYFLITTLTTVGYGDIVCESLIERIFQIFELTFGIVLYSYVISKLGDMIKRESFSQIKYNNNLAILEEIRRTYPKMPYKLYNKILMHLQNNAREHQKSNINFLINSLPHMLKHHLLFIINKNYIINFYFFKKCYNSNFITYSLINFKPFTSKKNTLLLKEDQFMDNVIFISEGRLSLEIAIDLQNPTKSLKKYLSEKYNSIISAYILEDGTYAKKFSSYKLNDEKNNINMKSNETFLKEHDKFERDFDESNYQFLNISNIFKNENYGEVYIIFNKPSPLFIRVKSKIAKLFLLNKKHVLFLSETYPNIWNRLLRKSLENMLSLKHRTIEVAKKYSIRYDINYLSKITGDMTTKDNIMNEEKIKRFSGAIKTVLSKKILNVRKNRYSIASCSMINVDTSKKNTISANKHSKINEEKKNQILINQMQINQVLINQVRIEQVLIGQVSINQVVKLKIIIIIQKLKNKKIKFLKKNLI